MKVRPQATDRARHKRAGSSGGQSAIPSPVTFLQFVRTWRSTTREGRRAMRDPLVRWASAGLILALPVLMYVAAATSVVASAEKPRVLALAGVLGPVEAALGIGLWLASRERRRL